MIDPFLLLQRLKIEDREDYEESFLKVVDSWIEEIGNIDAARELSEHFIVKGMIADAWIKIGAIDQKLLEVEKMEQLDRSILFKEKQLYKDFINRFDVERRLESIESALTEENL